MANNIDPNKNCHEYCRYAKMCRYCDGYNGKDPEDCPMYYKIDDLLMESRDIAEEQKREREEEEDW